MKTVEITRSTAAAAQRAMTEHRTTLRRKREQLAKGPVGRNYLARERQLAAYDQQIAELSTAGAELHNVLYAPIIRDLTGTTR